MLEQPEKIRGIFRRWGGGTLGKDRFPETFELGGGVLANPFHHLGRTRGEHGVGREGLWPGRAGEEFSLPFENRHVLGFKDLADDGDENRGVLAVMVARVLEAGEQAGGKAFRGDGGGKLRFAGGVESFVQDIRDESALELGAIGEPDRLFGGGGVVLRLLGGSFVFWLSFFGGCFLGRTFFGFRGGRFLHG